MSATMIIDGDATFAERDRIFDCPYCGARFIGHSDDTGFELASLVEQKELGITAKMTCPTCENTAVSSAGSAGEVPALTGLAIASRPLKTLYKPGDKFDPEGLAIAGQWSNGTVGAIDLDGCTFSPDTDTALTLDDDVIVVTHTASSKEINVSIRVENAQVRKPILLQDTYVYTGSAIAVSVSGFDSSTMTRSNYSKTTVGEYTVSYSPKTGYCWEDGTTDAVTFGWEIVKAVPSAPTVSPTEVELTAIASPAVVTVTRDGNGTITATSSDETVCTVSVESTSVTVTAVADGEATVEIEVGAGTNYLAPTVKPTVPVTVELA